MNVLVLNTHSVLNSGDAAIVFAQIRLLREFLPGAEISLTSRTPRLDEPVYEPMGIRVLPPLLPAKGIPRGSRGRGELLAALRKSDLVLASGGGYFWSNRRAVPGRVFLQNVLPVLRAAGLRKPIIFLPQSFGPMFSRPARAFLSACLNGRSVARIFAREKASFDFVKGLVGSRPNADKISLCPDLAFALDERDTDGGESDPGLPRPILAVTLRIWDFPGAGGPGAVEKMREAYFNGVVEAARRFIEARNGSALVLPQVRGPWAYEDDRAISRRFAEALGRVSDASRVRLIELPDAALPGRIIGILRGADAVLATRLHSAIFALLAGRIPVIIGYQPKSAGTMELLGLGPYCVDIAGTDPDRLTSLLEASLEESRDGTAAPARVAAARAEIREKIGGLLGSFAAGAQR